MAAFIYGENELQKPIFITFNMGYKNFEVHDGTEKSGDSAWKTKKIGELDDPKKLKEGVDFKSQHGALNIKLKKVLLIIDRLVVTLSGKEIKGHEYLNVQL